MSETIQWFAANPWVTTASFVIGVLGVALAIIFYFKTKKTKSPRCAIRSIVIIRNLVSKIKDLQMLYGGQPIPNLTVTKVLLWNAGNATIDATDVAPADPVCVALKDPSEILDATIIYAKNETNKFRIKEKSRSHVELGFDYFDKDEGIVLQILHTGQSSKDVEITGTIKGVGKLEGKRLGRPMALLFPPLGIKQRVVGAGMIVAGATVFVVLSIIYFMAIRTASSQASPEAFFAVAALLSSLYWGYGLFLLRRRIPKGFDVFEKEF